MATREDVNSEAEALGGEAPLELQRKEPVVCPGHDPCRHVRPRVERPRVGEWPIRLPWLAAPERFSDDLLGEVVEELGHHVELVAQESPVTLGLGSACRALIRVGPPGATRLAR